MAGENFDLEVCTCDLMLNDPSPELVFVSRVTDRMLSSITVLRKFSSMLLVLEHLRFEVAGILTKGPEMIGSGIVLRRYQRSDPRKVQTVGLLVCSLSCDGGKGDVHGALLATQL